MQEINCKKWDRKFYNELEKKNVSKEIIDEIKKEGISSQYGAFVLASTLEGSELSIGHCGKDFWWVEYCGNIIDCENKKVYLKEDFCALKLFGIKNKNIKDDEVVVQLAYLSTRDKKENFALLSKLKELKILNEKQEERVNKLLARDEAERINKRLKKEEENEKRNASKKKDEILEEEIESAKRIVRELNKSKTKQK